MSWWGSREDCNPILFLFFFWKKSKILFNDRSWRFYFLFLEKHRYDTPWRSGSEHKVPVLVKRPGTNFVWQTTIHFWIYDTRKRFVSVNTDVFRASVRCPSQGWPKRNDDRRHARRVWFPNSVFVASPSSFGMPTAGGRMVSTDYTQRTECTLDFEVTRRDGIAAVSSQNISKTTRARFSNENIS